MAFQKGNTLGARTKVFGQALKRAIAQDDGKRIREAAEKLLDLAAAGESWAMKELIDRLDGKPIQETVMEVVDQRVSDIDDATLAHIATRGSAGASEAQESPQVTH